MYVVQHPQHGISVRTTPCYPTGIVPEGREPEGWSETRVKLSPKAVRSLRNNIFSKTRILELATALYNAQTALSNAQIALSNAQIALSELEVAQLDG